MPTEVRKPALSLVHSAPAVPTESEVSPAPAVCRSPAALASDVTEIGRSREALEEMQTLLRLVATGTTPIRLSAVNYTQCRAVLLEGPLRPGLPGFILQCVSIFKFHEFINLYDARPEARLDFLEHAFGTTRTGPKAKPVYDVFDDPDF